MVALLVKVVVDRSQVQHLSCYCYCSRAIFADKCQNSNTAGCLSRQLQASLAVDVVAKIQKTNWNCYFGSLQIGRAAAGLGV